MVVRFYRVTRNSKGSYNVVPQHDVTEVVEAALTGKNPTPLPPRLTNLTWASAVAAKDRFNEEARRERGRIEQTDKGGDQAD